MSFIKISEQEELIGKAIVNAAYKVHKELGPGLLEKVYEVCIAHELRKAHLLVSRQVDIPIQYDGIVFDEGLRLDVLVEQKVPLIRSIQSGRHRSSVTLDLQAFALAIW
ncbi:MAG: GxxExxY protein [Cyclobacteriaceae bacterium]